MSTAINKKTYALVDTNTVGELTPSEDWLIDPQFDDPTRAFEVGPRYWIITGNNIHVMTAEEIDTDADTVDEARLVKRTQVNELREKTFYSGFLDANGVRWSSTPTDIANINAVCTLIAVGAVTGNQTWRDFNNVDHSLTPTELITLAATMAVFGKTCYGVAWYHKNNIDQMTRASDINNYDFATGWPT